jgi:hypothetical protein
MTALCKHCNESIYFEEYIHPGALGVGYWTHIRTERHVAGRNLYCDTRVAGYYRRAEPLGEVSVDGSGRRQRVLLDAEPSLGA